jgi:hypothetical protein
MRALGFKSDVKPEAFVSGVAVAEVAFCQCWGGSGPGWTALMQFKRAPLAVAEGLSLLAVVAWTTSGMCMESMLTRHSMSEPLRR